MPEPFDPYRVWLSIPPESRPPTHYQLLGVSPDEHDPTVINAAVMRQSAYVRNFQVGKYAEQAAQILNEVQAAKACLLDPAKRARYDAELRAAQASSVPSRLATTAGPLYATSAPAIDLDLLAAAAEVAPGPRNAPPAARFSTALVRPRKKPAFVWQVPAAVFGGVLIVAALIVFSLPRREPPELNQSSIAETANVADHIAPQSSPEPSHSEGAASLAATDPAEDSARADRVARAGVNESPSEPALAVAKPDRWSAFELFGNAVIDDFVRITHGNLITRASYGGPTEISLVARTKKDSIRVHAFMAEERAARVIWNWEANPSELRVHRADTSLATAAVTPLKTDTWYRLKWRITEHEMIVSVDDAVVFRETGGLYIGEASPVLVAAIEGSEIDVQSFEVTPLPAAPPGAPAAPAVGVDVPGEVDGRKGGIQVTVAPGFYMGKSWRLSLEFWAPEFPKDHQALFFWGDDRPGCDALMLVLVGFDLWVSGDGLGGSTMRTRLSGAHSHRWVPVRVGYDATTHELSLFIDGKRIAHEQSPNVPTVDRPMPIYLCHIHQGGAPFLGRVRNVRLENTR